MTKPQVSRKHPILHTPYFDRKLTSTGTTRTIAINGIIPDDWDYVRIIPKHKQPHKIIVELHKLAKVVNNAQSTQANQRSKQDS